MNLVEALRQGEPVLLETDTVVGLHALATLPDTDQRLRNLKGSLPGKPFLLLFADTESAFEVGHPASDEQRETLERIWPGPLTALLRPTRDALAPWVHDHRSVAARVPDHPELRSLIREVGGPLYSTSANTTEQPPALDLDEARAGFPGLAAQGWGRPGGKLPSTLVDLTVSPAVVLRHGGAAWPTSREGGSS